MRNFALDLGNVAAEFLNAEVSVIIVFVAVVVMAVLTLNSRTYAEVSLLLLTFLSTMIINKGTYFIFGTISFASNSVLSILSWTSQTFSAIASRSGQWFGRCH